LKGYNPVCISRKNEETESFSPWSEAGADARGIGN
jgi:hypothetical protein